MSLGIKMSLSPNKEGGFFAFRGGEKLLKANPRGLKTGKNECTPLAHSRGHPAPVSTRPHST